MKNNNFKDKFFLPIMLILFLFVIFSSLYALLFNYKQAEKVAKEVLVKTSDLVTNYIVSYIEPAVIANGIMEDYLLIHTYDQRDTEKLESLAMEVMDRYPSLRSFNLGFENGDFFMVRKEPHGTYSTKKIYSSIEEPHIHWRYRNSLKEVISEKNTGLDDYDPRNRPWYIGAMEQDSIYWSEIYTNFTDQDLGITVGYPLRAKDGIIGVFSFDIKVNEIAEYLSQVQISDHGEAIVVDYKKDLIAVKSTLYSNNSEGAPIELEKINDPVIMKSYELIDLDSDEVESFTINKTRYFIVYRNLDGAEGVQWKIGVIVPEDDFLSGFKLIVGINTLAIIIMGILLILLNYYRLSESKIKKQLVKSSEHDSLTGLLNRRSISRIYQLLLKDKRNLVFPIGVIMCDIDHFKTINDTYGHNGGDCVLREISNLMQSNLRDTDYLCRWGGEEFLIILPKADIQQTENIAEKLRAIVEGYTVNFNDQSFGLTMSFGAGSYQEAIELEKIVHEVDTYLYQAKTCGRNRVVSQNSALI